MRTSDAHRAMRERLARGEIKQVIEEALEQAPKKKPPIVGYGPGTELSKLFHMLGIGEKPNCKCRRHAEEMDRRGTQWCRENLETIVGWLKEEAKRRKLPFSKTIAKQVVRLAIRRAEWQKQGEDSADPAAASGAKSK